MKNKHNFSLIIAVFLLIIFGTIMIYSSSSIWAEYKFNDAFYYVKKHLLFGVIGIILMFTVSRVDYKLYYKKANWILGGCLFLLLIVLIPGIGSIRNGSQSWFLIGTFGIQPSEFAKLGLIIFVSKYLSNNNRFLKSIKKGVLPIILILCLVFCLIMLQPDFGTAMIIVSTILAMLFVAGVNMKFFYMMSGLGVIGVTLLILIAPYRMARIISFLNPFKDPLGSGFQIIQSLYAIGPGGLLGQGFLNSRQKHFYLPEPQTDFIFSIISEEFGFIGVIIVSSLFLIIFYQGLKRSLHAPNLFAKYLSFGIVFQIIFQTVMNLMVVIGLIPVTGVTLPFLSYGGSSLLISLISMGILLNISKK